MRIKPFLYLAPLLLCAGAAFAVPDKLTQELMENGIGYAKRKQYQKALASFNLAIERDSTNSAAVYNRGIVYFRMEDMSAALNDFRLACVMANKPSCTLVKQLEEEENRRSAESSTLMQTAARLNDEGKPDEALKLLLEATIKAPALPKVYYQQAKIYYTAKQDTASAIVALDNAIKYDSRYTDAYLLRGRIYTDIRRFKKAAPDLAMAVKLNLSSPEAFAALGDLGVATGDYTGAVSNYRKSLDLDDKQPQVHFKIAQTYLKTKDSKLAYKDFFKACSMQYKQACPEAKRLGPTAADVIAKDVDDALENASKLRADKKFADAVKMLSNALALAPDNLKLLRLRGDIKFDDMDDWKGGAEDYTAVINLAKVPAVGTLLKRAQANTRGELYDLAVKDYTEAALLDPNNPLAPAGLGDVRMLKGDFREALSQFDVAIGLDPKNGDFYLYAGNACRKLRQEKRADSYYKKGCELGSRTACGFVKK